MRSSFLGRQHAKSPVWGSVIGGLLFLGAVMVFPRPAHSAEPPKAEIGGGVDPALKPEGVDAEENFPPVFRDMGVVQKKAINKSMKLLLAPSGAMDFSDTPYSVYRFNFDLGFAFSDFFEVYAGFAPAVINKKRTFTELIESLTLDDGSRLAFDSAQPKGELRFTLLWAPLYGKDSFGLRRIVRSDTFIKAGFTMMSYMNTTGKGGFLGVGKTFFVGQRLGLRLSILEYYVEQIMPNSTKKFSLVTTIDGGLVIYLF